MEITVSKMYVHMPGDESVGLFPEQWTIEPEMIFENKKSLEKFKDDILIAFENAFGEEVYIETQEEIDEKEQKFIDKVDNIKKALLKEMNDVDKSID